MRVFVTTILILATLATQIKADPTLPADFPNSIIQEHDMEGVLNINADRLAEVQQGYAHVLNLQRDDDPKFKQIRGCDIYGFMLSDDECNLKNYFEVTSDPAIPDWRTEDPQTQNVFDPDNDSFRNNSQFNFDYESPGHICGWKITELSKKFELSQCKNLFLALLPTIEPNWVSNTRGNCQVANNALVESSLNCVADSNQVMDNKCCYFKYADRFNMTKELREDVFNKLVQNKAKYRHRHILSKSINTIAQLIKQTVHKNCTPDACDFPAHYFETPSSGNWDWNNGFGANTLTQYHFETESTLSAVGTCKCADDSIYRVAGTWIAGSDCTNAPPANACNGGTFTYQDPSTLDQEPFFYGVQCGAQFSQKADLFTAVMLEVEDTNDNHYYNRILNLRFQRGPHDFSVDTEYITDVEQQRVTGRYEMKFDYNPIGACRVENTASPATISTSSNCSAWTRTIHSEWTFEVYGEYKDLNISDALNADQLRIQMTPAFCKLMYRPLEISRVMLKCDMQTKLMHRITQKIWQEKIQAEMDEIIGGAAVTPTWHKNPDTNTAVYKLNVAGDAFELDTADEKIPEFYGDGDYWQIDANDNTTYARDAQNQPVIVKFTENDTNPKYPAVTMLASQAYIRNLYQLNLDIANYYNSFKTNHGDTHHVPHCLKKHLTHTSLDFYCLTAEGERIDHEKFVNVILTTNFLENEFRKYDLNDYEIVDTSHGKIIRSSYNTIDANGDVIAHNIPGSNATPDSQYQSEPQEFVDEGDVTD